MHKNNKLKVLINDNGIADYEQNKNIQIFCYWEDIKKIILTKNTIVILTSKKDISFYLPKEEKIINRLKTYKNI